MDALIRRDTSNTDVAMADVAGHPLLARQIQWLHAVGCDRVVVEIGASDLHVAAWLDEHSADFGPSLGVLRVLSELGMDEAIEQAALARRGPVLVLPAGVLGDGDLARVLPLCGSGGAVVHADPPPGAPSSARSGALWVRLPGTNVTDVAGPGWAIELTSHREAEALGCAALSGSLPEHDFVEHAWPIQIHAAQVRPGIWLARGAHVSAGATLVAPVLVGEGAVVDDDAVVGPNVVVGRRAAVTRGVIARDRRIPAATIVGPNGQFSFAADGSLWRALARRSKNALLGRALGDDQLARAYIWSSERRL